MEFRRIDPHKNLNRLIECYWTVKNDSRTPVLQKIVPDGFPEIIFHLADPYRIQLYDQWEIQNESLLAGQIRKYFFLENTGRSEILGIKLKPTAVTRLFGIAMSRFTDAVVPLSSAIGKKMESLEEQIRSTNSMEERVRLAEEYFLEVSATISTNDYQAEEAVSMIFDRNGMINVSEISTHLRISERYLEQLFKRHIGLPPKFYSRIIRFNYIFQLIQDKNPAWSDLVYHAGYYDQSHFIRNFKAFTGEDPSQYGFDEKNMANFFLKKE